jgi:hypothetical protein
VRKFEHSGATAKRLPTKSFQSFGTAQLPAETAISAGRRCGGAPLPGIDAAQVVRILSGLAFHKDLAKALDAPRSFKCKRYYARGERGAAANARRLLAPGLRSRTAGDLRQAWMTRSVRPAHAFGRAANKSALDFGVRGALGHLATPAS